MFWDGNNKNKNASHRKRIAHPLLQLTRRANYSKKYWNLGRVYDCIKEKCINRLLGVYNRSQAVSNSTKMPGRVM